MIIFRAAKYNVQGFSGMKNAIVAFFELWYILLNLFGSFGEMNGGGVFHTPTRISIIKKCVLHSF